MSSIQAASLNGHDPYACLKDVLNCLVMQRPRLRNCCCTSATYLATRGSLRYDSFIQGRRTVLLDVKRSPSSILNQRSHQS